MEKYSPQQNKKSKKDEDKNFILRRSEGMNPFKIEIYSEEFLTILADIISNPNTKYSVIDDMVDEIKKQIEMKIDSNMYKELMNLGEKRDIDLVCKYIAIQRILTCSSNSKFTKMIDRARESIRELPVSCRHVITGDSYKKIFAIIPAAYLCSVCNLNGVGKEVAKMDKAVVKTMSTIMDEIAKYTEVEDNVLTESYDAITEVIDRLLNAYRDRNIIDLRNIAKILDAMFDGQYEEYFTKLKKQLNSDISDSFTKFDALVQQVKETDNQTFTTDSPDPMEYDPVDQSEMNDAMGIEPEQTPVDLNNDSVLGPNMNEPVNTGLENAPNAQENQGVVTGLESIMNESLLKKKLKRISRESIGYVKVRGMNARDADELAMIVSYGYYVAEKCEWYMDIIQRQDDRYIVPQTYAELDSIRKDMYRTLDELMKDPVFRSRGSIYQTRGIELF